MNETQVRVPANLARLLMEEVHRPGVREAIVFGLASHARTPSRALVLVRELLVPPESAFLASKGHGARWSGAYMIELLNIALEKQLGLFMFHAHPGVSAVTMSHDDLRSAYELLPKFQLVLPYLPHGSIVMGADSIAGAILMPNTDRCSERFSFRTVERDALRTWPLPRASAEEYLLLKRQAVVDTRLLRKILGQLVIAIVGLSGGGSQIALQLAALGVGEIIGIDDQSVDDSNRIATPNLGWIDALLRMRKTTAAKLRVWAVNRNVRFTGVSSRVPGEAALNALKRADIIIGCVNNLHARADLNEIAWRYCIPYIDVGLVLAVDKKAPVEPKPLSAISGNVFTALPGEPCLWCADFLTEEKLGHETGGRGRSYLQDAAGRDAFVTTFNATLASEAASEVLRLVAGLRARGEMRRQYEGFTGTLLECVVQKRPACVLCNSVLAAGDPIWQPIP